MQPGAGGDGWDYLPESAGGQFDQPATEPTTPDPKPSTGRSLPARVLGIGAALIVTVTAAVIGFSAGNGGSSDSVLTIGDATVPSSDGGRPRVGDNTTTTDQVTTTTQPAVTTTAPTTTVPPTTQPPPAPTTSPPTNPGNGSGDGEVSRPPAPPPGDDDDGSDDDTSDDEPQQVTVPDVFGMHRDDAVRELESLGLRVQVQDGSDWGRHWRGLVQNQDPGAGREVAPDEQVTIWVGTR